MNIKRGQIWIRRVIGAELNDIDNDMIHVTLAYLGDDRFVSITAGGELHVWPVGSARPDWKLWEPISEENK